MENNKPYIVCFGEVLWDVYPEGKKLGGAPFNVTAHAMKLGLQASMISKIGNDSYGEEILLAMQEHGILTHHTQLDYTFKTGVVDVLLNLDGKPTYDIKAPVAWDYIHTNEESKSLVKNSEAFVYGSLICRKSRSKQSLFELAELSNLNICDLNIRQSFFDKELISSLLEITNILKINDEEADLLKELFELGQTDFYKKLSDKFSLEIIIQTLGANGAEAYSNGQLFVAPGIKTTVIDTVGSGDSFLAAFIKNYLKGEDISTCLVKGCELGAFVASKHGAIPEHPPKMIV